MTKRSAGGKENVYVRVDRDWLPRLDAVAKGLGVEGLDLSQSDALRVCIARGLQEIEKDQKRKKVV